MPGTSESEIQGKCSESSTPSFPHTCHLPVATLVPENNARQHPHWYRQQEEESILLGGSKHIVDAHGDRGERIPFDSQHVHVEVGENHGELENPHKKIGETGQIVYLPFAAGVQDSGRLRDATALDGESRCTIPTMNAVTPKR